MTDNMLPTFVGVIGFLAVFIILVGLIPGAFFVSSKEYKRSNIPDEFEALTEVVELAWYDNDTLLPGHTWNTPCLFQLPPADPQIEVEVAWDGDDLFFWHKIMWWVFDRGHFIFRMDESTHHYDWSYVNSNFDAETNISSCEGSCICGTYYQIFLTFNETKYDSFQEGWNAQELYCLIGVGIEDTLTKLNAWSVVAQLLMFQAPEVFPAGNVGIALNLMIAIPIYAAIIYLIYRLVLLAIPFVGG